MTLKSLEKLVDLAREKGMKKLVVAVAEDDDVLTAVAQGP